MPILSCGYGQPPGRVPTTGHAVALTSNQDNWVGVEGTSAAPALLVYRICGGLIGNFPVRKFEAKRCRPIWTLMACACEQSLQSLMVGATLRPRQKPIYYEKETELDTADDTPAYHLSALPANLLEQPSQNAPVPLHILLGMPNRELRKQRIKALRKMMNFPKTASDDEFIHSAFGSQNHRRLAFWKSKKYFDPAQPIIGGYYEVFRLSIVHSLLTIYDPYVFSRVEPECIDSIFDEVEKTGIPIREICENLEKREGRFDRDYLGFLTVWPRLLNDLGTFDILPAERRNDVANAVFALSSAVDNPAFIKEAIRLCPQLDSYFVNFESHPLEELDVAGEYQEVFHGEGVEYPMDNKHGDAKFEQEDWGSLVSELGLLVKTMVTSSPSTSLVEQLHKLVERMDRVPIRVAVSLDDVFARLEAVFARYGSEVNIARFEPIRADIEQVLARWKVLAREAASDDLVDLYDDLIVRPSEARPYEEAYLKISEELHTALATCEASQKNLAVAPLARKSELRTHLKGSEARRDAIEVEQADIISALCRALNYRGESFDVGQDWIAKNAATEANPTAEPLPEGKKIVANHPVAVGHDAMAAVDAEPDVIEQPASDEQIAPRVHAALSETTLAEPEVVQEAPEPEEALASSFTDKNAVVIIDEPVREIEASAVSDGRLETSPNHFWSMVAAGEHGLAHNLVMLSGPISGMPPRSVTGLLVLGTELSYPQGAIARALEEAVAQFDPEPEMNRLSGNDRLAANLLLVAATVRSGLLAPNTGANDLLNRGISLGAGWDKLHELTQIVSSAANQVHGVFLVSCHS